MEIGDYKLSLIPQPTRRIPDKGRDYVEGTFYYTRDTQNRPVWSFCIDTNPVGVVCPTLDARDEWHYDGRTYRLVVNYWYLVHTGPEPIAFATKDDKYGQW